MIYVCEECNEKLLTMEQCKNHLEETNHKDFQIKDSKIFLEIK